MWTYKIAEHTLVNSAGQIATTEAYSGFPPDKNDPTKVSVSQVGPLPPGDYTITPATDHPLLGPLAMYLEPSRINVMYGRGGFFLHGDSAEHPGMASHGCIILPHEIREAVSTSPDRWLHVTA